MFKKSKLKLISLPHEVRAARGEDPQHEMQSISCRRFLRRDQRSACRTDSGFKVLPSGKTLKLLLRGISCLLALSLCTAPLPALAKTEDDIIYTADGIEDYYAEQEARKKQPVQTNEVDGWPKGPSVSADGAIVMDADSGAVLYGKNIYKHLYPASITKIMTALLAYENLEPTDTVTFSENAIYGIESGSSNIGMDVGESITVEEALYGMLVASANEVSVALGERVSGSEEAFADLMNTRAAELGCENTHFVTLNGLHDPDHYTCANDMALIARECYKHPDLIHYMSMANYEFHASENQPDEFWLGNTDQFLTGEIQDDDVVAGKTGYTDQARQTLVTFAERDGKRLICVIMKEERPEQYYDTIRLLDYAFDNFQSIDAASLEDRFTLRPQAFLGIGTDVFGGSGAAYRISSPSSLTIPQDASFKDLTAEIIPRQAGQSGQNEDEENGQEKGGSGNNDKSSAGDTADTESQTTASDAGLTDTAEEDSSGYTADGSRILGTIHYKYNDHEVGTAQVLFNPGYSKAASASALTKEAEESSAEGATALSADVDLPDGSTRTAQDSPVLREVHGIRALFFGLAHTGAHGSIYLNILLLLPLILAITFILCVIFFIHSYFVELEKQRRKRRRRTRRS